MSPKSKKPAGGRAGKNFDPRYGENKTSYQDRKRRPDAAAPGRAAGQKPGSRSAGHRGYRAESEEAPAKRRWTSQERAGRDESRGIRNPGRPGSDRGGRDSGDRGFAGRGGARPETGGGRPRFDREERPSYGDRPQRGGDRPSYGRDDRSARPSYGRDDRSGYGDRPQRGGDRPSYGRDDRSSRPSYGRDDRASRPQRDDRPSYSRDDRAARPQRDDERPRYNRDERPARRDGDRPQRDDRVSRMDRVDRDDRRSFGDARPSYRRDDRPGFRDDRAPRRDGDRPRFDRDDRAPRRDDRAPRDGAGRSQDRPRSTGRDDRGFAPRGGDRTAGGAARPRFDRDDRGARRDDRGSRQDDRAPRRDRDERPRRDAGARPERTDRAYAPGGAAQRGRDAWTERRQPVAPSRDKAYEQHVDVVHERLQAEAVQATDVAGVTFGDLGLGENIVRVLADLGASAPFAIQAATIPAILEGKDVLARGRTGSGKTIAFGAPLVESILRSQAGQRRDFGRSPKALILAPTRELALQIDRTIQPIARSVGLFTTQIYGGVPQARQVGALKKGVDIIIGTPGRIEDLVEQRKLDLSQIRIAVLDEADHMCELGFLEPVQRILRHTADGSQKLLFSATLDREVAALVDEFLVEPAVHEVAGEDQESSTIDHRVLVIDHRDKAEILTSLVDRDGKTLVFARTRAYAEMLAEQFDDAGIHAVALHGDLNQAKRTRNLEKVTSGRVNVLVATDVAARGIHVDDIDLVIQADAPDEYKTYLHRSGRTGRAGRSGTVVTLITRQRRRRMVELLERAEIDAPYDDVRIGDDLIEELSGRQVDPTA